MSEVRGIHIIPGRTPLGDGHMRDDTVHLANWLTGLFTGSSETGLDPEMSQTLLPCPPHIVEHPPEPRSPNIAPAPIQLHLLNNSRSPSDVHAGKSWAESVEDPWLPLILTLDGGGIRGYASLLIIERLMDEVAVWENHFERIEQPDEAKR